MSAVKILTRESLSPKICVVVGTRPGIIKFSPVVRSLERKNANYFVLHTGQHYSYNMDRKFFEDLELRLPSYTNDGLRDCYYHGEQTAVMVKFVERVLLEEKPQVVVVGGDANTNLAGALATRKLASITLAHMEAGLRSNDWRMPEEHNRVMIDHISDILFAPTAQAKDNLVADNVKGRIFVTGNTIVDAVFQNLVLAKQKSNIIEELSVDSGGYFLFTCHREENVDSEDNLRKVLDIIRSLNRLKKNIIFPLHPRTERRFAEFGLFEELKSFEHLRLIPGVGYLDFLCLLSEAALVLTDSGGIQEEACILRVPCVTLRESTERPETLEVGSNFLAGLDAEQTLRGVNLMLQKDRSWSNPFGDGRAGERISDLLIKELSK